MDVPYILRAVFEILVIWVVLYQIYRAFKDSRAAAILGGLLLIVVLGGVLLELTHAAVLQQIAGSFLGPGTLLIMLLILFQPELRSGLARLGAHRLFGNLWRREQNLDFISCICESVSFLVSKRYGALIAICRNNKPNRRMFINYFLSSNLCCLLKRNSFIKPWSRNHSRRIIFHMPHCSIN